MMRSPVPLLALAATLLMITACGQAPDPDPQPSLSATLTAEPATVTAKTTDPPFTVTVTTTSMPSKAMASITVAESAKGIVTQGTVSPVGTGLADLAAKGNTYTYETDSKDTAKIAFTCTNPGVTTLSFLGSFTKEISVGKDTQKLSDMASAEVKVTCTGPTQTDLLTAFFQLLGIPKPVAWLAVRLKNMIDHSTGTVSSVKVFPDMIALASMFVTLSPAVVLGAFGNTSFPCGQGKDAYTVCPGDKKAFPEGETIIVMHKMDQPVELNDSKYSWVYGFVFDQDGDTTNNYQPGSQYPKDFYKDTDRWYEAHYAPGKGWSQKVTDATGGTIVPGFPSAARIIFFKEMAVLVVPAKELAVKDPKFRITVFRHTGDYGMNPPHDWSGDMEPPVDQGLREFGK